MPPRSSSPLRRIAKFVLLGVCSILIVWSLRGIWGELRADPDQYLQGFFEHHEDGTGLTLDQQKDDLFFPNLAFSYDRKIDLPPGTSVAIPLPARASYSVSLDDAELAPYCVFGLVEDMGDDGHGVPPFRLASAQRLAIADGALVLKPWTPERPYADDKRDLAALSAACIDTGGSESLIVRIVEERVSIRLGRCTTDIPLSATEGRPRVMAVMAGLQWHFIERLDGGFRARREVDTDVLRTIAVLVLLTSAGLAFTLGPPALALITVLLIGASLVTHPLLVLLLFGCFGILGALLAPLQIVLRTMASNRPILRGAIVVSIYATFGVLAVSSLREAPEHEPSAWTVGRVEQIGTDSRCLLVGYSTINDTQIRHGTSGTWRYLAEQCGRCGGGVDKYGRSGATFFAMRDFLCAPSPPVKAGQDVIFVGAGNDDTHFWVKSARSLSSKLAGNPTFVRGAYYLLRQPSGRRLRDAIGRSAQLSQALLDEQLGVIEEALACTARAGGEFWYVHDFLVIDLDHGRGTYRDRMAKGRADTVTRENGHFVDLLERFGDVAGIAWFNDMIHLSSIGHRHTADLVCRELASRLPTGARDDQLHGTSEGTSPGPVDKPKPRY